jgi:hypothetical protein
VRWPPSSSGLAYRSLTGVALGKALKGTAAISGVILFIIIGATTFSADPVVLGRHQRPGRHGQDGGLSPWSVLA